MKVLQVNPYPPEHLGGSEIFCKNLAINLKKYHNIDSEILTSDIFNHQVKKRIIEENVPVFYKKCYKNLWGKNPITLIYDFIKKNYRKYDIIHAHSYIFFTSLQCALVRKLKRFNLMLHIHGGVQTPSWLHSNFQEYLQLLVKENLFDKIIGNFILKNSDVIVSVSQKDLNVINNRYSISKDISYCIPNAVDINKFQPDFNLKRKYITFIGRLSYIKGFDIFLEIISKLNELDTNLEFLIIGDGPLRPLLDKVITNIPITYYRSYPYEKMQEIYNVSKALMITSRFEGVPTTILESLACETPVITSNVGGITEVIKNEYNGIVIDPSNFYQISEEILNKIHQESYLAKMGKNGRKVIEKNHSWQVVTNQISKIYEKIVNN